MMLKFDEEVLTAGLSSLPLNLRVSFATACAERLTSAYKRFWEATGRGSHERLVELLDRLWLDLEGSVMTGQEVEAGVEGCLSLIPRESDGPWAAGQGQAEDAAAALTYAYRCRKSGDSHEAAWAARCAYNALDEYVIDQQEIDTNVAGAEAHVLSDPLIQNELARQQRDLQDLLSVLSGMDGLTVSRLRDRARAESETFFELSS